MKTLFQIIILSLIIVSCKNEIKETPNTITEKEKLKITKRDTFIVNFQCEEMANANFDSELKTQLRKLDNLENNYQILESGKTDLEESIVFNGLRRLPKLNNERYFFQIDSFRNDIREINYGQIKGTKDLGSKTYARARVEELIFNSEECANRLVNFINQIKEESYAWEYADKAPSSIFQKENKAYYIATGGSFMKPFCKEIEDEMRK